MLYEGTTVTDTEKRTDIKGLAGSHERGAEIVLVSPKQFKKSFPPREEILLYDEKSLSGITS
jgi:hypothetical protein